MSEALMVAQFLINSGYAFLTSFNIPGTNFTPLLALFMSSFIILVIKFVRSLTKLNPSRSMPSSPPKFND